MKNKIKQTSKKYIVIPVFAISLIAVLIFANAEGVSAQNSSTTDNKGEFARVLAEKFNLDQVEVEATLHEFRNSKHDGIMQRKQAYIEEKFDQAVSEGSLTETQRYDLLGKFEEMHNRLEEVYDQDLPEEEIHELRVDIHEEMQVWAEDQGLDFEMFLRAGEEMSHGSKRYLMH